jgi:hypothetical protein
VTEVSSSPLPTAVGSAGVDKLGFADRDCDRRQGRGTDVIGSMAERAGATITEAQAHM